MATQWSEVLSTDTEINNIHIKELRDALNILQRGCNCNCHYGCTCQCYYSCTCQCNYCTCHCNHGCTCQCAYNYYLVGCPCDPHCCGSH